MKKNVVVDTQALSLPRLKMESETGNTCESHFMKYIYDNKDKVPLNLKVIAEQQKVDKEFEATEEKINE